MALSNQDEECRSITDNCCSCACASYFQLLTQVNVGSLSDPLELPGLAHFLEHMLFYSNSKYPEEDAYSRFIVSHP